MMDDQLITESERARILSEEALRLKIQAELSAQKPVEKSRPSWWEFLNNSFTIFLISSVLIPVGVWRYSAHVAERDKQIRQAEVEQARQGRIERLDTEISFRLSQLFVRLEQVNEAQPNLRAGQLDEVMTAIAAKKSGEQHLTLYPPFAEYSLLSLLGELRSELIASGVDSERMVPPGPGTVNGAIRSFSVLAMLKDAGRSPRDVAKDMLAILKTVKLSSGTPRWNRGFIYTDCPLDKPFC